MNRKLLNITLSCICGSSILYGTACQNPEIAQTNQAAHERILKGERAHIIRYPWQENIPVENLNSDQASLKRVLTMNNEERLHRLPSFSMKNTNKILFNRGTSRQLQEASSTFNCDTKGNFHFFQKIGRDDVEYIEVDNTLYVRYVNGPFRDKPSLNQPVEMIKELPAASITESFEPWIKFLHLSARQSTNYSGRSAYQYDLSLQQLGDNQKPVTAGDGNSDLDWHNFAWPTDIKGKIIVDSETAVLLSAHLEVNADILDRPFQPTTLQYTFNSDLSNILKTPAVTAPNEFINEYQVIKPFRGGKFSPKKNDNNK